MLAAISTTILSRRSCAETCSAIVSRSRPHGTGGPPAALRISSTPLPPGPPTGRARELALSSKRNKFIHSVVCIGRITPPKQWHSSQSGSSSGRIPNRALFCQAKGLPARQFKNPYTVADVAAQLILQPLREIVSSCPDFEVRGPE